MKTALQQGLRTGAVFGIVIVFMALIGFTVTGPILLAKILGNAPKPEQMPAVSYLVLFLALTGVWCGAKASTPGRYSGARSLSASLAAGAAAGAISGLIVAIYAWIMGGVDARGTDLRPYLAQVSPAAVKLFLFQLGLPAAALAHLGLLVASSLGGALLAHLLRAVQFGRRVLGGLSVRTARVVQQARRFPYAIYVVYAVLAVLLIMLPRAWGSYWNYIIGTVGLYVILGLGLNIIVGMAGQLVLGYVAFFAIGAYTMALLTAPQPHALG